MAPLVRLSMTEQVVAWLRGQITDGIWPIGTQVPPESELAQELGVARNTIRESVRALVHTGVLEIRRGAGTFVRSDTEVDAVFARHLLQAAPADTAELRRAIEVEATRLACTRRNDSDIERLQTALKRREEALLRLTRVEYENADYQFHYAIVLASHNILLNEFFRCLASQVKAPVVETPGKPTRDERNRAHRVVVDAIIAKDETTAIRASFIHLDVVVKNE